MSEEISRSSFSVVAIGASAGGLNALNCFIGTLPKDFGFAVVFFQHLSPKHKSLLPELLHNRRPDIHICEVSDGMRVRPGQIFLCPAGKEVSVTDGSFRVTPLSKDHIHLPIDEFFSSLSEETGGRTIAVIFSGAGTDGARGVKAVRTAGGTVFVQDPATAEFPSMPLAAISTGQVDAVLPPEEIAREIENLVGAAPAGRDKDLTLAQFDTFSRLLYEKAGQNFKHYKKNVVSRRIKRRIYLRGVPSVQDYMKMVAENDSEAASLAADLMIGVTSFFRDRLAWKALRIEVMRKLGAADEDQPVRVWTPACATGEEAYSIAMMLRHEFELAGKKREIQVFASDINDAALEKAREGKYPGSINADVPPEYMKRFFTCSEDGLSVTIAKEIRESVVFARHDLLTDPPFSRLDLIICRNLLIYLEQDAQEKCIAIFHYALKDGGYLFLGNAESPGRKSLLFKSLAHKKCRIYRKIETKQPARLSLAVPFATERAAAPSRASAEYQQSVAEFAQQALLEESGPAAVAINHHYEIVYSNGPTNRYLRQPRGAPTQNLLELLPENLKSRIRGALYRAAQEAQPVSIRAVIAGDDRKRQVTFRISKLREDLFLIVFGEKGRIACQAEASPLEGPAIEETAVRQLESELAATKEALQNNIEQLKSLNEELQSSNEELQAANEELETSREELQSLNEELITVNSQLQSKIEEQEETNNDLNNFLTSTNIPTVFLDHQFRVKRFTPAMSRLIKLIPSDAGRPISDLSQENLGPELIADAESVLEHLVPVRKEMGIDGAWYVRTALPYRTSDNRIEGVVVTYNDVTEIKRAEERTRHLASFPRLNPNPVIEVDSSGKITFSNPATEKILEGLAMDKGDASIFLPADMGEILGELANRGESTLYREVAVKDRIFGETVHVSRQFNVVRIYGYEITEIKKAQQIKARLAAIVESADDAIISKDLNGIITTWNIGAEKIFGYTAEEAIGRNISFLVPPGHADDVPDILSRIARGTHIEHFETERMRKDGTIIPVLLTFSPIVDADGKVIGASKIAHDITERKGAEREREIAVEFLHLINMSSDTADLIRTTATFFHEQSGCEAVGIRLREDRDYPYIEARGFPEEFVEMESSLCARDAAGNIILDSIGSPVLSCMCGNIICGRFDPEKPFFTKGGSFWTNSTTELLATTTDADREARTRNRCNGEGYESVALMPLRIGKEQLGLIQLNDRRKGMFSPETIAFWERLAGYLSVALAKFRSEEALKESEEQFRTLADSIPNLAWWANGDGYITWYNRRWYDYTGTTPEQMEGWGWQSVHDPEVLPRVLERWKASLAAGEPFDMEFPIRGADGIFRPFLTRILPLKDPTGRVLRWFGTNTDITERKRAEEDIARKANLINIAYDSIFVRDWDDQITFWNRGAEEMYGWRQEEMLGKVSHTVLQTSFPVSLEMIRAELLRTGKWEGELEHLRKDGSRLIVSSRWSLLKSADGTPVEILEANRDVTERRRAETELLRLNKVLKALSDSSQAIIRAKGESEYLADVCKIIVEDCGYSMAWIGYAENDQEKSVRPVAHSGFEEGYLETLKLTWADTERGLGPTGRAIRTGKVAVCRNMLSDPAFAPWREEAVRRGYASSIVFPLLAGGKAFGAITMYSREADPFSEGEVKFLTELAENLAYGIKVLGIRTAQGQAEEALRTNERRLGFALDAAHASDWEVDLETGRHFWGERFMGLLGVPPEAFAAVEQRWAEFVLPEDRARAAAEFAAACEEGGPPYDSEFRARRMDGIVRWYRSRGAVMYEPGGGRRMVGVVQDITEQKLAEKELRQSLSRFELLTTTAGELLQSTEPQKVVESVCRKVMEYLDCHAFFNFLADEQAGKLHLNACAGIPEEEEKRIEWLDYGVAVCGCAARDAQRIIAEHIPTTPDERTELVKSYGIKAYCCHPLLGPGGRVIGTLSFGTRSRETFGQAEISLMKAVADQVSAAMIRMRNEADVLQLSEDMAARNVELESVNRELESFIYSISHDLRAPLRSMGGFAKIMEEDYLERLDDQGRDYLRRIRNSSEKMTRLIDDLLHLSKISRQEVERMEIDLSGLASSVASELREAGPGRSVEIVIADGLTAFADLRLTEIVLSNLLGNAWKFTSGIGNARIEFGVAERDGKSVYFVKDNGAGFNPDYTEKMFLPFQRLHAEKDFPGTGIGLTIVERIIHLHGGRIWAEGEVGKGATVYFTLG